MTKTPKILKLLYPNFVWDIKNSDKKIYLTFDDGPVPEITEFVLDNLKKYNAKATFFCVGDNIEKHPQVFNKILAGGHSVGNHTFKHIKGWNSSNEIYLSDVKNCQAAISQQTSTNLFRPPYGRIKRSQAHALMANNFKIIMWSVLTRDYDASFDKNRCLKKAINATKAGSIVLFHDSKKAQRNMYYVLPKFLDYFNNQGFEFAAL